jgi:uncharacterized membrane protein HdeD (DUF308 family)
MYIKNEGDYMATRSTNSPYTTSVGEMRELCSKRSWLMTLGFALIILGGIALVSSLFTTLITVYFIGTLLLAEGITNIFHAIWLRNWKGFFLHLLLGILYSVGGVLMFIHPGVGAVSLTLMLAAFLMVAGLFRTSLALTADFQNWFWLFLSGIITFILGIIIFAQLPTSALWVVGAFLGIDMIVSGWSSVMLSYEVRRDFCR